MSKSKFKKYNFLEYIANKNIQLPIGKKACSLRKGLNQGCSACSSLKAAILAIERSAHS